MAPKPGARIIQLDFLRGIAILLVLGQHLRVGPGVLDPSQAGRLHRVAMFFYLFGWTGVDLFFVLSGFLIGGLLFGEIRSKGSLDVKRFLVRRGFKIWPLYYLYLVMVVLLLVFATPQSPGHVLHGLWGQFANLQNYFGPTVNDLNTLAHTWSLAVEEHFYLALPVLLLLLIRTTRNADKSLPALPFVAVGVMILCLTLRLRLSRDDHNYLCPTHLRMDSLFFGVLLAYGWHYHQERLQRWLKWPAAWLVAGLLLLAPIMPRFHDSYMAHTVGYVLLYLGYGCILLALMATYLPEGKNTRLAAFFTTRLARAVAYIGFFSYPIYLFHMFPGKLPLDFALNHFPRLVGSTIGWIFFVSIYIASAVVLGAFFSKVVEVPALALRDRLFPALSGKAVVTSRNTTPAQTTV